MSVGSTDGELVFVYGTLQRGERYHAYLEGQRFVGEHETRAVYRLLHLGGYPGVVPGGATAIRGELWRVTVEVLGRVDELEEVPDEYGREHIATPFGEAWIYLYRGDASAWPEIPGGDWRQRQG
jgi:gamma-glutamylcyclotransferase (GGCT)/AIG2-like uncharacterized protein YtfP